MVAGVRAAGPAATAGAEARRAVVTQRPARRTSIVLLATQQRWMLRQRELYRRTAWVGADLCGGVVLMRNWVMMEESNAGATVKLVDLGARGF
jgi:hypothetical protein